MQKEEKLKRIEEVIKVTCPELMELSFGCRYLRLSVNGIPSEYDYEIKDLENGRHYYSKWPEVITGRENEYSRGCLERKDGVEILGHPIRLSHVLRAIVGEEYAVTNNGTFLEYCDADRFHHHDVQWDLANDDLSLQSPDTIDFLFKILCE